MISFSITDPLSQVKADKDSPNLARLQQASKGVTQATARVVASTKSGKSQIEETGECVWHLLTQVEQGVFGLTNPFASFPHLIIQSHQSKRDI